ncbi:acyl-CoA carboxylase subunit epsilon [Thermostaphylospora chromogena]|uniref:Acyl-CoA carboxylase epsilon subunit n=1 Tax=Thermostaphylospora chromogena TaxID=35622 RepID=A0A1H1EFF1_9ACTN|nr:acyl-CoA carboxylase subunit epsilon [Thermostaphylospora chromogena]SDQ87457.1 Acyl-CoA carboxylase epsilon subunit [Thermostaphylospora chromogena]
MTDTPEPGAHGSRLRIVRGSPAPEEIVALAVALTTASAPAAPPAPPRSRWSDPASRMRRPLSRGPDAWRRGSFPA